MLAASCPFSPPRKKSIYLVEAFAGFFRYFAAPSKLSISWNNSINMILQPFVSPHVMLYFTLRLHIVVFHQALALLAGCSCHSPTQPRRWLWGPKFIWTWNPLGHKQSSYSLRFFWSFTLPHKSLETFRDLLEKKTFTTLRRLMSFFPCINSFDRKLWSTLGWPC